MDKIWIGNFLLTKKSIQVKDPLNGKVCGKCFKSSDSLVTHTKHVHKILTPRMKPIVARGDLGIFQL